MDYDQNILPSVSLLEQIQLDYQKHAFNTNNIVEDDAAYNLTTPPSEPEEDYDKVQGDDLIDLD